MNDSPPIKIIFWNANGIQHKINEFLDLSIKTKADIILLSETNLNSNKPLKLHNFHTYRTDKPSLNGHPSHGGTAVLVHRRIVHTHVILNTTLSSTSIIISIGQHQIRISSIYKSPSHPLSNADLDILTTSCDWFIAAGDINAEHPMWNSRHVNPAGNTVFHHVQQAGYAIVAPNMLTHYPAAAGFRPDVLDIAMLNLPNLATDLVNLNDPAYHISLCYYLFTASGNRRVNSKSFSLALERKMTDLKTPINTPSNIDAALFNLTDQIKTAIETSSRDLVNGYSKLSLPPEISREWQYTGDPAIKRRSSSPSISKITPCTK